MNIKDSIREAFMKKFNEAIVWNPEDHPNIYELVRFLRKSGYRLLDIVENKGSKYPEVLISPRKPGYLYPDIIHDTTDNKFYVDVKKYGLLEISDLEGIIQGYENALSVVKHLESLDLSILEYEKEEEEDEE